MNLSGDEEKRIRSYLLGQLKEGEMQLLEERLLRDDEFIEQVRLAEDELIDDYARGALGPRDRESFEQHFALTPKRQQRMMLVEGLRKVAAQTAPTARVSRPLGWIKSFFFPTWRVAVLAALFIVVGGAAVWRVFIYSPPSERALLALRKAYGEQRPLETRISGLDYAPFPVTRGGEPERFDARARDHSAAVIHADVADGVSAAALHNLGRLYLTQKDFDKATLAFEDALKVAPGDASLHGDAGVALFEKGKRERLSDQSGRSEATLAQSLARLNRALELDDSLLEARFNRALLYMTLRLPQQASKDWEKYLALDPRSPWADEARRYLAQIREQSGKVSQRNQDLFGEFMKSYEAGDHEQALRVFNRGHLRTGNIISGRLVDEYLASASTGRKGEAEHSLRALVYLGQLAREKVGDNFTADLARFYASAGPGQYVLLAQARELRNAAYDSYSRSRHDQAIGLYAKAAAIFGRAGGRPEALLAEYGMGHCYYQQADTRRSFSLFTRLDAECGLKSYRWLQALTLNGLGNICTRLAQYTKAVEHIWASYELSKAISDENGVLRSLSNLSGLYRSLGGYYKSLRLAKEALDLSAAIAADNSQTIGLYATSAWCLTALGLYDSALEYEKEAVRLGREMNNPLALSRYHVQLGLIQAKLNNFDEALGNVKLGLEIGRGGEKINEEMSTYALLYMGRLYRESGLFTEALAALQQVVQFCLQNDEAWLLHEARKEQLLTHVAQGQIELAREELALVLSAYEEQREKILEEGNRNTFFDKEQDIYDLAIDFAHISLRDPRQSFVYSETSRSRSRLDAAAIGWRVQTGAGPADLRFTGASRPAGLDEIMRLMPAGSQILQYAALKDKLVIWYVSGGRFESRVVEIRYQEFSEKVDRLLNLLSKATSDEGRLRKAAAEVYDLLLRPVIDLIDPGKQLCIIPDKILNFLPYGALVSSATGRYVAEDLVLIYAPSANVFLLDTKASQGKGGVRNENLLSVGNPLFDRAVFSSLEDLPSAAFEATQVTNFYDPHLILRGPQATKDDVLDAMRHADVLHLATHYVPDSTSLMFSKLLLARGPESAGKRNLDEGILMAQEIYRLYPLRARLAVLSACQTGVEGYFRGEGAIGLARPFHAAGVPLVVASLWPVDSQATADLMINFHRLRKLSGLPTVKALQGAQIQMLKGEDAVYRHPYYWASFAAIGGNTDY